MNSTTDSRSPAGADIELAGVTKAYAGTPAVADLTVRLAPGELCCLLGPSGCGKSTTLRLIAGLEAPDAGTIRINGRDMRGLPPQRRNLGFVFQNYALFPHMDVFDNVAYGLRSRGGMDGAAVRRAALDALAMVRLDGYADRRVHELSGGEQQRVALARALVTGPDALLLDEPFSNLDARLREAMRGELAELRRRLGITTVFVTHDKEEAFALADRIVLLRDGRLEQQGPPEELYRRPASAFAAGFLGSANCFAGDGWPDRLERLFGPLDENARGGLVVLRPERVRPEPDADGPFVVAEALFMGPYVRYLLRRAGDPDFPPVEAHCPAFGPRLTPGARVAVRLLPEPA
ncbi:ABC transporter related protein [Pseudodesulfovibrio mercurii]|uniref:ABC transporter related protein n=1 Tax=Pseudodesulfovibrio mercurii TaxID=641491 RepID=F0JEK7_9BACT|nr:ABC transporter ATP-binding protein [Pseudodesulfovibrio mercurii]EGB14736.1 ABC transporter related protein [Pseudodesulfovibrio mercurii]